MVAERLSPITMLVPRPAALDLGTATDDEIMCAVQSGQVDTLARLFERYHVQLLSFFTRSGSPRAVAEDLVQDVFVRILKYRATYRAGSRFVTWMYYIARNARLDLLHKRRGEVEWDDSYTPSFEPDDAAQQAQEHRLLARAMDRLPADTRELLVLCRYQELTSEEVGAILGCETGTVKVRVHRALRELRAHFEELSRGDA